VANVIIGDDRSRQIAASVRNSVPEMHVGRIEALDFRTRDESASRDKVAERQRKREREKERDGSPRCRATSVLPYLTTGLNAVFSYIARTLTRAFRVVGANYLQILIP